MSNQGREYLIIPQIVIEAIEKQLRDERNTEEFKRSIDHEQETDHRTAKD